MTDLIRFLINKNGLGASSEFAAADDVICRPAQ
jgi:hypothetical protein